MFIYYPSGINRLINNFFAEDMIASIPIPTRAPPESTSLAVLAPTSPCVETTMTGNKDVPEEGTCHTEILIKIFLTYVSLSIQYQSFVRQLFAEVTIANFQRFLHVRHQSRHCRPHRRHHVWRPLGLEIRMCLLTVPATLQ